MSFSGFVAPAYGARPIAPSKKCSARTLAWNTTRVRMTVSGDGGAAREQKSLGSLVKSVNKFTRPHTIRGTILGAFAGCTKALVENSSAIDWGLIPTAVMGLVALLCGNAYIVGINQIYDIDIDKVNKPFLPLASGEMNKTVAWTVVLASLACGMAIVYRFYSSLIFKLYSFGLLLGTIYSVPPFHLKRFPVLAALIISTVRGFLLNFGVYHATCAALKVPFGWNVPIAFLATFMTLFAVVIALSKDIPDIEGDRTGNVETFSTRLGPRRMVQTVTNLLTANYMMAIGVALRFPTQVRAPVMIAAHLAMLVSLRIRSTKVEYESKEGVKKFYAFIWLLFYLEYMLFPFL
ncbi:hypothetical protein NDN08_001468 [Rhodosorus marinus]|uniref:Homogentisate solanesyltransferase n=1 Tax=Rhodosorus marinus TaxID=101924 RepID=A0AAV8UQV5_9RHOD|nr:hypothetical protein NDN08_001468 [Rhodosorus marinus]